MAGKSRLYIVVHLKALTINSINKVFVRRYYLYIVRHKRHRNNFKAVIAYVFSACDKCIAKSGVS